MQPSARNCSTLSTDEKKKMMTINISKFTFTFFLATTAGSWLLLTTSAATPAAIIDSSPLDLRLNIVGGRDAPLGSAPYQVALYLNEEFYCSGVLLAQRTVLTAAQCIRGHEQTPHLFTVRYGSLVHSHGVRSVVVRVLPHPKSATVRQIENDLAILHLASPVAISRHTFPAQLAEKTPFVGSAVTISGWGTVQPKGAFPRVLQLADTLRVVPMAACQEKWGKVFELTGNGLFCAESPTQSACHWDSGGPVVQADRLVGVISFGAKRCLEQGTPNGYVDIATHRHWILEHLLE